MGQEEQVLVVERKVVEAVGMFQGLTFDVERYLAALFDRGVPSFMPRSKAEDDPSFKQLIPYVIMVLFLMVRPYGIAGREEVERV